VSLKCSDYGKSKGNREVGFMGRAYAGVMGPLAFLMVVVRSLSRAGAVESTVFQAAVGLFAFAAIGYVIGQLAGWIVDDSVRAQLAAEMAARAKPNPESATAGAIKKT
jgi:hypothetical protein